MYYCVMVVRLVFELLCIEFSDYLIGKSLGLNNV